MTIKPPHFLNVTLKIVKGPWKSNNTKYGCIIFVISITAMVWFGSALSRNLQPRFLFSSRNRNCPELIFVNTFLPLFMQYRTLHCVSYIGFCLLNSSVYNHLCQHVISFLKAFAKSNLEVHWTSAISTFLSLTTDFSAPYLLLQLLF